MVCILIDILRIEMSVDGAVLRWLYSYLDGRCSQISWNGVQSVEQVSDCVLTYRSQHGLAPDYLASSIRPVTVVPGRRSLRSACRGDICSFCLSSPRLGNRSFTYSGPSAWNALPIALRDSSLYCHVLNPCLRPICFTAHNVVVTYVRL